jgi:pimeloyl-ACP methyl ester carboxylesterase
MHPRLVARLRSGVFMRGFIAPHSRRITRLCSARLRAGATLLATLLAALLVASPIAGQVPTNGDQFIGTWQGTLGSPAAQLQLGLAVARDPSGALRAAMTSANQPGLKIPATATLHGDTLVVDIDMIHGSYAAVAVGDSLIGSFTQNGLSLPFHVGRVGALAARHSQDPRPPFPYQTRDVTIPSVNGIKLAGTLTIPAGRGPFPAVVLVPGSGREDRDESFVGHKPFLVFADYLARHGIASLRYDDRGVAKSTGIFAGATSADLANDAEAAVHFVESQPDVARSKVGIVGHSEGGMIGAMIAARSPDVAFLVMLAAPGLPGDSVVMLQKQALFTHNGLDPVQMRQAMRFTRQVYDLAKSNLDSATATTKIQALTRNYIASLSGDEQANADNDGLEASAAAVTGAWFRYLLRYDPRTAIDRVHVPVLAVGGALDDQVTSRENLPAIDAALKAAGNRDYRIVTVPNVNHSLQTVPSAGNTDPEAIDETVSPAVLDLVTSWIAQRFAPK